MLCLLATPVLAGSFFDAASNYREISRKSKSFEGMRAPLPDTKDESEQSHVALNPEQGQYQAC